MSAGSCAWRKLLSGSLGTLALAQARALADAIAALPDSAVQPVAHEAALVQAYLARAEPGGGHCAHARRLLELASARAAADPLTPALFGGVTGIAWVQEHLAGDMDEDGAGDDELDEALADAVAAGPWPGSYDLVRGLVGIALFALERVGRPAAGRTLVAVLGQLERLAEDMGGGVAWRTGAQQLLPQDRALHPRGRYDLGMAHGAAGVVALLAQLCRAGVERERAAALLTRGVSWLVAQAGDGDGAAFAPWVGHTTATRTGWCYGDPGVATALWSAGCALGREDWTATARTLFGRVARRAARPDADLGIVDACLCHGSAGLAHLFNRAYQATGDAALGAAAIAWIERMLAARPPDATSVGLLRGTSGVALVLLAASTAIEPAWDRMLLLSPAARGTTGR